MSKNHTNENYIHNCGNQKTVLNKYIKSITDMGFTDTELVEVLSFFLFKSPTLQTGKVDDPFGSRSLKSYGWKGNSDMSKLEGSLLRAAGLSNFYFIKSDEITGTLKMMNLCDEICSDHPRAVLKQNFRVNVLEDGTVSISQQETRMECLFRHIRNSFAHNHTYFFPNDNILLENCDVNGKVSARILMPKDALLKWIGIVRKDKVM